MSDTKQRILDAALDLFSTDGYEAVSMGQLAAKVGIKAPSLYKHFPSKQTIMQALIEYITLQYERSSVFTMSDDAKREEEYAALAQMPPDAIADRVLTHVRVVTRDNVIQKTRKLLTIEQFRTDAFRALEEKHQYADIARYYTHLMRYLADRGILTEGDALSMALQFLSPVTLLLQRIDRDPACEEEVERIIRNHVAQFFKIYGGNRNAQN